MKDVGEINNYSNQAMEIASPLKDIWIDHIFPLMDRESFGNFRLTCRANYELSKSEIYGVPLIYYFYTSPDFMWEDLIIDAMVNGDLAFIKGISRRIDLYSFILSILRVSNLYIIDSKVGDYLLTKWPKIGQEDRAGKLRNCQLFWQGGLGHFMYINETNIEWAEQYLVLDEDCQGLRGLFTKMRKELSEISLSPMSSILRTILGYYGSVGIANLWPEPVFNADFELCRTGSAQLAMLDVISEISPDYIDYGHFEKLGCESHEYGHIWHRILMRKIRIATDLPFMVKLAKMRPTLAINPVEEYILAFLQHHIETGRDIRWFIDDPFMPLKVYIRNNGIDGHTLAYAMKCDVDDEEKDEIWALSKAASLAMAAPDVIDEAESLLGN